MTSAAAAAAAAAAAISAVAAAITVFTQPSTLQTLASQREDNDSSCGGCFTFSLSPSANQSSVIVCYVEFYMEFRGAQTQERCSR